MLAGSPRSASGTRSTSARSAGLAETGPQQLFGWFGVNSHHSAVLHWWFSCHAGCGRAVGAHRPGGAAGVRVGDREAGEEEAQRRRAAPLVDRARGHRPVARLVAAAHAGELRAALDHRAVLVVEVEEVVVARPVAARAPDALATAGGLQAVGDAAERGEVAPLVGVVGELGAVRAGDGDAVVVVIAVPPGGEEAHAVREAQAEAVGEEALLGAVVGDLAGEVLELDRPVAGRRRVGRLHAAEELVDVAAGGADLQRAVDAGLAVVDAAEQRAAGGRQALRRAIQDAGVRDLEREVRVAAVGAVLDQDQLVVALVAGEVAGAGDAFGLDHADDLVLEVDGGVEVGDVEGDVPDAGDHGRMRSFVGAGDSARARRVVGEKALACSSRKASIERGARPVRRRTWSVAALSAPLAK